MGRDVPIGVIGRDYWISLGTGALLYPKHKLVLEYILLDSLKTLIPPKKKLKG